MPDWNYAAVFHAIAREIPDRPALLCGDMTRTWAEFDERAARLASWLREQGVRPGDNVAIDMTNRPEYLEVFVGTLKLGATPVNVNYRYLVNETHYVLDNSDAVGVICAPEFVDTVRGACDLLERARGPWVLVLGEPYEAELRASAPTGEWSERPPSGDDLIIVYTGGTTGMPKGVMWRNDDLYVSLWQVARPGTMPADPAAYARSGRTVGRVLPGCPLMHGTGLFMALTFLAGSGSVVLVDRPGLDAELLWSESARHAVTTLVIVGDAFARPLLGALEANRGRWDLSALRQITSSGLTFSPDAKQELLRRLPGVIVADSIGSTEGLMSRNVSTADTDIKPARFIRDERTTVLDEETLEPVAPGSGRIGLLAVSGALPVGYYKDPDKSAATWRVATDGKRYSVPGDYALVEADGTITLLGRGSACINTGGEKVYPEEVELAIREHPGVFDCIVVGVPDERFGERVTALVVPTTDAPDDLAAELDGWCRERLAGYKRPKQFFVVESLERSDAGKANYPRLRELAAQLAGAPTR